MSHGKWIDHRQSLAHPRPTVAQIANRLSEERRNWISWLSAQACFHAGDAKSHVSFDRTFWCFHNVRIAGTADRAKLFVPLPPVVTDIPALFPDV